MSKSIGTNVPITGDAMPILFLGVIFLLFTGGAKGLAPLLFFALPVLIPVAILAFILSSGGTKS